MLRALWYPALRQSAEDAWDAGARESGHFLETLSQRDTEPENKRGDRTPRSRLAESQRHPEKYAATPEPSSDVL